MANISRLERLNGINFEKLKANLKASKMPEMLKAAALHALPTDLLEVQRKQFWLASIGERKDGVLVSSRNGAPYCTSTEHYQKQARSHSEVRLLSKMGHGGVMYVARVSRNNFDFAMSRPCSSCSVFLKARKIDKVIYSVNHNQYGVWWVKEDRERIFTV